MPVTEETKPNEPLGGFTSYKEKYSSMKMKLKELLYENELFQDELRKLQRELLDIYRDKETLLERVMQFEDFESSNSDSESQTSDNVISANQMQQQQPQPSMMVSQSNFISNNQYASNAFATTNSGNLMQPSSTFQMNPATAANSFQQIVAPNNEFNLSNNQTAATIDNISTNTSSDKAPELGTNKSAPNSKVNTGNAKPKATAARNRVKTAAPKARKNGSASKGGNNGGTKQSNARNQKQQQQDSTSTNCFQQPLQQQQSQQQLPMTIVGQVQIPVSSFNDQFKYVQSINGVESNMTNVSLSNQADLNRQTVYTVSPMTSSSQPHHLGQQIIHQINLPSHQQHQMQSLNQNSNHELIKTVPEIGSFQQIQQPQTIINNQGNNNYHQNYTLFAQDNSINHMNPSPISQMSSPATIATTPSTTLSTTQHVVSTNGIDSLGSPMLQDVMMSSQNTATPTETNSNGSASSGKAPTGKASAAKPKNTSSRSRSNKTTTKVTKAAVNKQNTTGATKQGKKKGQQQPTLATTITNYDQQQQQHQQHQFMTQQQAPMTIVGQIQIPVSGDGGNHYKYVQQVNLIEHQNLEHDNSQMDTSIPTSQHNSNYVQVNHVQQMQNQEQFVHQINLPPQHLHHLHHQQIHEPQTTTSALDIESFHHIQQPQTIITTQSNHSFQQQQGYTMVVTNSINNDHNIENNNLSENLMTPSPVQITSQQHQLQTHHQLQQQLAHHHHQQQALHQPTEQDQLTPEELEQHLENRRMEQAALLMPDWESSVPSEIFGADSAIKFMAED